MHLVRARPRLALALITIAVPAPFLGKAFHIDDPLFIWMAEQIQKHPLDPYGFTVNWSSYLRPISEEMQNPPLCSYYIAAVISLFGRSEIAVHGAFVAWAIAALLGVFQLARRFTARPIAATLLTLFTPVFLISATTIMCDVMMLAFFVWAIVSWVFGMDHGRLGPLLISALLIILAMLTKYFGIALVPLLLAYAIQRDRGWRARILSSCFRSPPRSATRS